MTLKLVASLAFLAAASAALYGANTYYVNVGYGNIVISNPYGYEVNILANSLSGYSVPQNILVQVNVPGVVQQTVQYIDQEVSLGAVYQSEILYQIFKGYSGQLNEIEYQKLVNVISTYVQNGQINPAILYALESLVYPYGVQSWNQFVQLYNGANPGQQGFYGLYNAQTQMPYSRLGYFYGLGGQLGGVGGYRSYLRNLGVGASYPGVSGYRYPQYGYPQCGCSGHVPYVSSVSPIQGYGSISGLLSQVQEGIPYTRQYNTLAAQVPLLV